MGTHLQGRTMARTDVESEVPAASAEYTSLGPGARSFEDYTGVVLEDGSLMIYRPDELSSWITADVTVALSDVA